MSSHGYPLPSNYECEENKLVITNEPQSCFFKTEVPVNDLRANGEENGLIVEVIKTVSCVISAIN